MNSIFQKKNYKKKKNYNLNKFDNKLKNKHRNKNDINLKKNDGNIFLKKKYQPKITYYLHRNLKLKQGIFLKKPSFHEIRYPFPLNLKLIHEYLKKK